MPASLSSEGSTLSALSFTTYSTASTQPYLPGQRGARLDPAFEIGYNVGIPTQPDPYPVPRRVDDATRRANPAFYNPQRVNNADTFNYAILRAGETGQRFHPLFRAPKEKKVGFHGPPVSNLDTSDGVSKTFRYFDKDEKPEVQYVLKSPSNTRGPSSHTHRSSVQAAHARPASPYEDSNGRTRPRASSNRDSRSGLQYGRPSPRNTYIATPSQSPPRKGPKARPAESSSHYYRGDLAYDQRLPSSTFNAPTSRLPPRKNSRVEAGPAIHRDSYPRGDSYYGDTYAATPSWTSPRRNSRYGDENASRRGYKEDFRRKSSVHDNDAPTTSSRAALRPVTRSRQNSQAGLGSHIRYAPKSAKQKDNSKPRVVTVPSAHNEAYRNAKLPRGDRNTQRFGDDFWRLNSFEYDNWVAWYRYHWPTS